MLPRSRVLVLFALAAPTVALAAAGLRPKPRREPLPNPAVVVVDGAGGAEHPVTRLASTPPRIMPPPAEPAAAGALVTGNVVDLKGRAMARARISLRDLDGALVGAARADDDGYFEVHAETDALIVLSAQAGERRGLAGPFEADAATEHPLRVVVAPAARLRGVVVDAHGVPVEGVVVDAQPTRFDDLDLPALAPLLRTHGSSDATGHFDLDIPTPDAWTVTARHAGFAETSRMGVQMLGAPRDLVVTMITSDAAPPEPPLETAELLHDAAPDQYLPSVILRDVEGGLLVLEAAADARLLPGDRVIAVDGVAATRGNPWNRLAGVKGSKVDLEVERPATGERLHVQVVRTEPEILDDDGC